MNSKRRKERRAIKRAARARNLSPVICYADSDSQWDPRTLAVIRHKVSTGTLKEWKLNVIPSAPRGPLFAAFDSLARYEDAKLFAARFDRVLGEYCAMSVQAK